MYYWLFYVLWCFIYYFCILSNIICQFTSFFCNSCWWRIHWNRGSSFNNLARRIARNDNWTRRCYRWLIVFNRPTITNRKTLFIHYLFLVQYKPDQDSWLIIINLCLKKKWFNSYLDVFINRDFSLKCFFKFYRHKTKFNKFFFSYSESAPSIM